MIDSFLKYLQFEKRLSANTLVAYETDLTQFQSYLSSTYETPDTHFATYTMVRSWVIYLVENKIDAPSINRKIACLRTYFKFLLREEIITKDPMQKIQSLKTKKKLPSFVKEADVVNLLDNYQFEDTLEGWREKIILELFYATGIRLAELLTLKESNIDFYNRTIKVLGKRNKERVIPFAVSLVSVLEGYMTMKKKCLENPTHDYLIVTNTGAPAYPTMVYTIVKKHISARTSAEKKSPHVLRHTYATHLMNKGAEINAVKDLLGHTSLAATQVYTHNSMEKLKKVFDQAHPKA